MAEEGERAQLVDFWRADGMTRITLLRDYEGDGDASSFGYRVGDKIVKANNDLIRSITGLPGQFRENWSMMRDPEQRKLLARGLIDASALNAERRKALFSILLWGTLAVWVIVGAIVASINKDAFGSYQSGWSLFFYSLATSLFLPTPFEILLGTAVEQIGVLLTVLIGSFAKVVGAWLVLMMGEKAAEGLDSMLSKSKTLERGWHWLEKRKNYGYPLGFVMFAIPFMSDTAPLFMLAVLDLKKGLFLLLTFIAIVIRSLLFIYAGDFFAALF